MHLVPALVLQGVNATGLERFALAEEMLDGGESLARELGDAHQAALARKIRGALSYGEGKYEQARDAYEQSLAQHLELRHASDAAGTTSSLGHVHLQLSEPARARELFLETLETQRSAGNRRGLAECLLGFGALARWASALRLVDGVIKLPAILQSKPWVAPYRAPDGAGRCFGFFYSWSWWC